MEDGELHLETGGDSAHALPFETLARLQNDLNEVIKALSLLGVKRCCQCQQFFRSSEPGVLFDCGKLVCYTCLPQWWRTMSEQLRVDEREKLEAKLASFLRKHHGAEIVKQEIGKVLAPLPQQFQIVVRCKECVGSGKVLEGERCRFCNGFGTLRVVTPL
jgi:hypothetical protein